MEVNAVVPNIVLHFKGFRLSLLSNLNDALWHLAIDMLRKMVVASAACGACVLAGQAMKMAVPMLTDGLVSGLITFATFSSCTVLAQGPARLMSQCQLQQQQQQFLQVGGCDYDDGVAVTKAVAAAPTTLPLLSAKHLAPITCSSPAKLKKQQEKQKQQTSATSSISTSSVSKLPSIRRRVLSHLRQGPPIVNVVAGETRRRAQMSLHNAKIRVGKAHTQLLTGAKKPQDVYMVRVDCGSQGSDSTNEKHMNPVIMWDITATFDEFKKLEHEMKREVKTKKMDAKVPHLSSGAVLFVQQELTDHVLNARRTRLQAFIDTIRTNEALATTDCLRKFCQAY